MELKRKRRRPLINIVPLIDVLIVLIFFFLLTMQFRQGSVLDITPPKVTSAGHAESLPSLVLAITVEGGVFVNGRAIAPHELPGFFDEQGKRSPVPDLLVAADENVPLKALAYVIDLARQAGLGNVRLQVR